LSSLKGADRDQASRTSESFPVHSDRDQADFALEICRRAFLADRDSNPSRELGQVLVIRVRAQALDRAWHRESHPFPSIDTSPRATSGFSQPQLHQGRQVWYMRQIMRPLCPTI